MSMRKHPAKRSTKAQARLDDPIVSVAYRVPKSILTRLDELATGKGVSRNAALSIAVSRLLDSGI